MRCVGRRVSKLRWRQTCYLTVVASMLAGCDGPFDPRGDDLAAAKARWAAAALTTYEFDYQESCFCPPDVTRPVTIEVVNGSVTTVTFRDDGTLVPEDQVDWFRAVSALFDLIEHAIGTRPRIFEATYDPVLGFPTLVSAADPAVVDGALVFQIERLAAVFPTETP